MGLKVNIEDRGFNPEAPTTEEMHQLLCSQKSATFSLEPA